MKNIFITGATGFVGTALCLRLIHDGLQVRAAVRSPSDDRLPRTVERFFIKGINPDTDWISGLQAVDTVVHLAARTHVMHEKDKDPLHAYRVLNVQGTERLARSAAASGVKRFIYLSSVKVNGEGRNEPYTELDRPAPEDAYGISKWEAEQALRQIGSTSGMEVVIIRPPLVYGPGVKANFLRLMQIVDRRMPLPLGSVNNRRSMIYLDNLVDAITACILHKEAAGKTYLVSDGDDVSTPDLVRRIAYGLGKAPCIFSVPTGLIRLAGNVTGKTGAAERLLGSLTVSTAGIRRDLNWTPPFSLVEGIEKTTAWYKQQARGVR